MKEQISYSDEYINAYIDGELDNDERTRLLFDEQTNKELAQRISDARILKEKVQLTYHDVKNKKDEKKSFSFTAFIRRHALVASLLLFTTVISVLTYNMNSNSNLALAKQLIQNTRPVSAQAMAEVIGDNKHIIINVSQYQPQNFTDTINTIEALLQKHNDDTMFTIEIVASGQGLKALDTASSLHVESFNQLVDRFDNLEVIACAKSLAALATDDNPVQLIKSIMLTPSVVQQVAKRTGQGWYYLKL